MAESTIKFQKTPPHNQMCFRYETSVTSAKTTNVNIKDQYGLISSLYLIVAQSGSASGTWLLYITPQKTYLVGGDASVTSNISFTYTHSTTTLSITNTSSLTNVRYLVVGLA